MGRKKQGKFVRPDNKGKDKRHKMKGKSLEAFTEEMHSTFEGNFVFILKYVSVVLCQQFTCILC